MMDELNKTHPEFFNNHEGKIPDNHPDRQKAVDYINQLAQKPHPQGLNSNKLEARKLYDKHIAGKGGAFTKSAIDKLEELYKMLKPGTVAGGRNMPTIKTPGVTGPKTQSTTGVQKLPGIKPGSKVNPVKSAEQTQNKDIKDIKMKEAQQTLKVKPLTMKKKDEDEDEKEVKKGITMDSINEIKNILEKAKKEIDVAAIKAAQRAQNKKDRAEGKLKAKIKKRKAGEKKALTPDQRKAFDKNKADKDAQKAMEQKLQDPEFKGKALVDQQKRDIMERNKKKLEEWRKQKEAQEKPHKTHVDDKGRKYVPAVLDEAIKTPDNDPRPPVARKKRKSTFIEQFNRRKEAPDKKLINKENKGQIKVTPKNTGDKVEKSMMTMMQEILRKAVKIKLGE